MQFIKFNPMSLLSEKHSYLTQEAKADILSSVIPICDNVGIQSHVKNNCIPQPGPLTAI